MKNPARSRPVCSVLLAVSALCALWSVRVTHADSRVPSNLGLLKDDIKAFYADGTYETVVEEVVAQAMQVIHEWEGEGKPAIVLDVDDTAISTLDYLISRDFGYIPAEWTRWARRGNAPAIPATLELAEHAHEKGFEIFFITGRLDTLRRATENNLRRAGYPVWTNLIMKSSGDWRPTSAFKAAERKRITEEEGYTIVLNLGDQPSETKGGYAEHFFVLPNPAYHIP